MSKIGSFRKLRGVALRDATMAITGTLLGRTEERCLAQAAMQPNEYGDLCRSELRRRVSIGEALCFWCIPGEGPCDEHGGL